MDGYRYSGKGLRTPRPRARAGRCAARRRARGAGALPRSAGDAAAADLEGGRTVPVTSWAQALAEPATPAFEAVPFDHPLVDVYSSGTTGMPKPIVHGHGGVTIEALKDRVLALDLHPEDRVFWFSSTNWIMWNWLVSSLSVGCTVLQFDGNPGWPRSRHPVALRRARARHLLRHQPGVHRAQHEGRHEAAHPLRPLGARSASPVRRSPRKAIAGSTTRCIPT